MPLDQQGWITVWSTTSTETVTSSSGALLWNYSKAWIEDLSSSSYYSNSSSFSTTIVITTIMMLTVVWIFCFSLTSALSINLVDGFLLPFSRQRNLKTISKPDDNTSSNSSNTSFSLWRRWRNQRRERQRQQQRRQQRGPYLGGTNDSEMEELEEDDYETLFLDDIDDNDFWDISTPLASSNHGSSSSRESSSHSFAPVDVSPHVTHFCFLVHGHRGLSKDLRYMQTVMRRVAANERRRRWKAAVTEATTTSHDDKQQEVPPLSPPILTTLSSSVSESSSVSSKGEHTSISNIRSPAVPTTTTATTTTTEPTMASAATATPSSSATTSSAAAATTATTVPFPNLEYLRQDMVIHTATCNEHKTTDGVRNGGERLVEEMLQVITTEMDKRPPPPRPHHSSETDDGEDDEERYLQDVTISVVGNSLGGLFGRYAIAKLMEQCTPSNDAAHGGKCWILRNKYRIHLNVFCTTATPHLGVSGHTYLQIPRAAEIGVAHAMGNTGKDLFRVTDLIHTMATCPSFLRPLASFRKRIAYANAYGTDFPVPASTAAFLSDRSTYPHHFGAPSPTQQRQRRTGKDKKRTTPNSNNSNSGDDGEESSSGSSGNTKDDSDGDDEVCVVEAPNDKNLIIATLHTLASHNHHDEDSSSNKDKLPKPSTQTDSVDADNGAEVDDLHHMSTSLDQLGWKKVFVDLRPTIPSAELPQLLHVRRKRPSLPVFTSENYDCYLQNLRQHQSVVSSKDIASAVATPPTFDRLQIPLGHNMMVAFSRSPASTSFYKGGRPVVDALAKELVEDIFTWNMSASIDNSLQSNNNSNSNGQEQRKPKLSSSIPTNTNTRAAETIGATTTSPATATPIIATNADAVS